MLSALKYFVSKQPLAFGICVLALGTMLVFAVNFALTFVYFHDPEHRNQALEGWMRPRYVAMSYHLPPGVLANILEIAPPPERKARERLTMADVAAQQGVTLEELTARLTLAAAAFHGDRK